MYDNFYSDTTTNNPQRRSNSGFDTFDLSSLAISPVPVLPWSNVMSGAVKKSEGKLFQWVL
jgi:hypothetical protein